MPFSLVSAKGEFFNNSNKNYIEYSLDNKKDIIDCYFTGLEYDYEEVEKISNIFEKNYTILNDESYTSENEEIARCNANKYVLELSKYTLYQLFSDALKSNSFNLKILEWNLGKKQNYIIKFNESNTYLVEDKIDYEDNILYELITYIEKAKNNKLNKFELDSLYTYFNDGINKEKIEINQTANNIGIKHNYNKQK